MRRQRVLMHRELNPQCSEFGWRARAIMHRACGVRALLCLPVAPAMLLPIETWRRSPAG